MSGVTFSLYLVRVKVWPLGYDTNGGFVRDATVYAIVRDQSHNQIRWWFWVSLVFPGRSAYWIPLNSFSRRF